MSYPDSQGNTFALTPIRDGQPRTQADVNQLATAAEFLRNTRSGSLPCDDGRGTRGVRPPVYYSTDNGATWWGPSNIPPVVGGPDSGLRLHGWFRLFDPNNEDNHGGGVVLFDPLAYVGAVPASMSAQAAGRFVKATLWGIPVAGPLSPPPAQVVNAGPGSTVNLFASVTPQRGGNFLSVGARQNSTDSKENTLVRQPYTPLPAGSAAAGQSGPWIQFNFSTQGNLFLSLSNGTPGDRWGNGGKLIATWKKYTCDWLVAYIILDIGPVFT